MLFFNKKHILIQQKSGDISQKTNSRYMGMI